MPIYEYRCGAGHEFEVIHAMTDGPVAACEICGEPVERVFHPVAVHFKGSGFYTTDYARKSSSSPSPDGAGSDGAGSSKESGKEKESGKSSAAKGSSGGDSGSKSGEKAKAST